MAIQYKIDGGWGWIIVMGSAMVNCILSGYGRGFGIFFSAFQSSFGGSASEIALVNGVRSVFGLIMCPLAIILIRKFTERTIAMVGGGLISLSFILCVFANSMAYVIYVNGIIGGIGSTMVAISSQTIIGYYFDKRKSLASTLACAGSGVGQLALPSLIVYWLQEYGLRGMMLLFGGFTLHLFIAGALYTPFKKFHTYNQSIEQFRDDEKARETEDELKLDEHTMRVVEGQTVSGKPIKPHETIIDPSTVKLIQEMHEVENGPRKSDQYTISYNTDLVEDSEVWFLSDSVGSPDVITEEIDTCEIPGNESGKKHKDSTLLSRIYAQILFQCHDMFSLTLFKHLRFTLYVMAAGLGFASFLSQSVFLIPRALEQGVVIEQAALLLSIVGGVDIVGRVIMGIVSDIEWIGPIKVMIVYSFGMFVANLIVPYCASFATLAIYAVIFGLIGSSSFVLSVPIILTISLRNMLLVAVGMVSLAQAASCAVFPVIMGLIYDNTGTYGNVFYTCAGIQLIIAAVMGAILYLNNRSAMLEELANIQILDHSDIKENMPTGDTLKSYL